MLLDLASGDLGERWLGARTARSMAVDENMENPSPGASLQRANPVGAQGFRWRPPHGREFCSQLGPCSSLAVLRYAGLCLASWIIALPPLAAAAAAASEDNPGHKRD